MALADQQTLPVTEVPFHRYLWVEDGTTETARVLSLALNMLSRAATIQRPAPVQQGQVLLLRVDLRHYAPRASDLREWVRFWEELQFDPRFNLLLTKGILRAAARGLQAWQGWGTICRWRGVRQNVPPYVHTDGQTYDWKTQWQRVTAREKFAFKSLDLKDVELIRLAAPHLNPQVRGELEERSGSQAPVVSAAYFAHRTLATIQDKGLYALIYGGLYYEFAGIRQSRERGVTDEDLLLQDIGAGDVGGKVKARDVFEKLRSDQRVAILRSDVTAHVRRVDFFRSRLPRLDVGTGVVSFSQDLAQDKIDVDTHPFLNLLDFQADAREGIWERANGLHGYVLIKAKDGSLQREVPPDIAKDHTIAAPHTARLQAALGCIACHETEGSDGWKPVVNDVKRLLGGATKLDIFGDLSRKNDLLADTLDRLAGLYQGDPERALQRSRDDYAAAVLRATGPWQESKRGQADVVKIATTRLVNLARDYWYVRLDARRALAELGVVVPAKDALKLLRILLPPDQRATVAVPEVAQIIVPEDVRLGALRAGSQVNRADWDLVYAFAAERAQPGLLRLRQEGEKKR